MQSKFWRLVKAQLKTGALGFGGPLATMSMMRTELVEKEQLLPDSRYMEGLGVVKLLPGPVAVLLSVFLGQEIFGWIGGVASAICFIFPSFLMILLIAIFEQKYLAQFFASKGFQSGMLGVQIAVMAVIAHTCYKLFSETGRRKFAGRERYLEVVCFALAAATLAFYRVPEFLILMSMAFTGVLYLTWQQKQHRQNDLVSLFFVFFKAGLTVFGTGYMILPYLDRQLVQRLHWINSSEFLNAVAYGNLTPGPITIASTYIGYKIDGLSGALSATLGIYLGPIILLLVLSPFIKKILGKAWVEGALLGLLPAVAATIAMSSIFLFKNLIRDKTSVALLVLAFVIYFKFQKKIPTILFLLSGAVVGLVLFNYLKFPAG